jgi:peptidoglycan/LPS O-acetylase OafA/YrhL
VSKRRTDQVVVRPASWFRGDINGLRVLAILPVVAFHAGVPGFSGGFIGVDVFYVISGFLITTNLLREVESHGRIDIGQFWAKRVRRLVPASVLVVLVSLPVAMWLLSPLQWAALGKEAGAALLYVSNVVFSQQATDYFATDLGDPSPFLHTWSLGVEEQFYLLWPVLIIAACVVALRAGKNIRRVLFVVFTVTMLVSFLLSLHWTATAPNAAFYLLPARAWEFAAAGLLALIPARFVGSRTARSWIASAGVLVLLGTVAVLPESSPFPGTAALLPVVGTMLVIVGGRRGVDEVAPWPARALAVGPMQWVGTLSYSWYLWHWPFIVLAGVAIGSESVLIKVLAAIASLAAACFTYYFVENPIRFSPALVKSVRRTFVAAAAATVVGLLVSGGAYLQGKNSLEEYALIDKARQESPTLECDRSTLVIQGESVCEMGDLKGDKTVVLIGDSHAGQWKDALGAAAKREGVRLVVRWTSSCPAIGVDTVNTDGVWTEKCPPFVRDTLAILGELQPDAVLLSQAEAYDGRIVDRTGDELSLPEQLALWRTSYSTTLTALAELTPSTGILQDNPRLDYDPNTCLVRAGATSESCASPREIALAATATLQSESAAGMAGHNITAFFTTNDKLCSDVCKVVDSGVPVYRDYNHLSRQWTMTQVPDLQELLIAVLD